ncbi:amidohydrolase [Roseibium sp. MMSF_3544]|uniref:amidohydrolase family protein n=1 Tax=unclassified Roseibium TaxID=2629323 RepID=UPI00273FC72D|nr:amidohydrolase family protein [Roseibium sp. MMSF_3544]
MFQFDCHAHVYEAVSAISQARYVPETAAPLSTWKKTLDRHGLTGGVIVQVSFLGTDNSELCDALKRLDPDKFAGVAVVPVDIDDAELDRLVETGIRGLRWNLVGGADLPIPLSMQCQTFFEKLKARNLHLEIHLEGPRLAPLLPVLADQGLNLVIDHFGLPSERKPVDDPMIKAVRLLHDRSNIFYKFSAPYRTPFDLTSHGEELLRLLDEGHVVWGSDWPHTQHEGQAIESQVHDFAERWKTIDDGLAVKKLFGLSG